MPKKRLAWINWGLRLPIRQTKCITMYQYDVHKNTMSITFVYKLICWSYFVCVSTTPFLCHSLHGNPDKKANTHAGTNLSHKWKVSLEITKNGLKETYHPMISGFSKDTHNKTELRLSQDVNNNTKLHLVAICTDISIYCGWKLNITPTNALFRLCWHQFDHHIWYSFVMLGHS